MKPYAGDVVGLVAHAECFFRANKLLGPAEPLSTDEVLGTVRSRTALLERLMACAGLTRSNAAALLSNWVLFDSSDLQDEVQTLLGDAKVSQYMTWSYRNAKDQYDPFNGVDLQDLPCRLGLPSMGADHYAFGHMLPAASAPRKPTAFDGGMNEQWIPGGYTLPYGACQPKYSVGLPEVVHEPNRFRNIYTSLKELPGSP
jgi:hypothetical protein